MIAILGAGISGLCAARQLLKNGVHDFVIFDRACHPGGRVASLHENGYCFDAGFQVANSSYATLASLASLEQLDACFFDSGALMQHPNGRWTSFTNPIRHPWRSLQNLKSPIPIRDYPKLLRLAWDAWFVSDQSSPISCQDLLNELGFERATFEHFFHPFFGGVFLENDLNSSSDLILKYFKNFLTGQAFLPAKGMSEIPKCLAAPIPLSHFHWDHEAVALSHDSLGTHQIHFSNGSQFRSEGVILALDPFQTSRLLGAPTPVALDTEVQYFTTKNPPKLGRLIALPSQADRLVQHFCCPSHVSPHYAPEGEFLLSATLLGPFVSAPQDHHDQVFREMQSYLPECPDLRPLKSFIIQQALPIQDSRTLLENSKTLHHLPKNLFVAGDYVKNASLENAAESGILAANALMLSICELAH